MKLKRFKKYASYMYLAGTALAGSIALHGLIPYAN